MSEENKLWQKEESLWTQGAEGFRSETDDTTVMVFPSPVGILRGQQIIDGLEGTPRWRSVRMTERNFTRYGNMALLAYHANAEREGQPIYEAFCSTTYVEMDGNWRLIHHQQSPSQAA